ncbi:MAG: hypothetical protein J6I49_02070 [Bacteroidales bacterium]|nr:hypothetical protein [Bacteroidales bacterium]
MIPFEKITLDLGTYDWNRDWTVRINIYTPGRTDCYTTGITFVPQASGDGWAYRNV